jgi:hypothetical protein
MSSPRFLLPLCAVLSSSASQSIRQQGQRSTAQTGQLVQHRWQQLELLVAGGAMEAACAPSSSCHCR